MKMTSQIFWAVLLMLFAIVEIITPQMTTIWLAAGSGAALIVSFILPELIWLQILVFVIVSLVLLLLTRKLSRRLMKGDKKRLNADRCIDEQAVVVEEINNLLGKGQVSIKGVVWTARAENDEIIAKDELVVIKRIEGVKVIVDKV